jgi:pre-mRNA-splicing factor CWC26
MLISSCYDLVIEHRSSAGFKPIASPSTAPPPSNAQDDIPADEAPVVVGSVVQDAPTVEQSATAASAASAYQPKRLKGGLQTSAQLKEENARRQAAGGGEDTVYRDASGKRIDAKAAKAEMARAKRAEMEKEMAKMEWGKGLVQREEKEKRQRELEDMANKSFARFADDEDINDDLKEKQRWNDPAARFLSGEKKDKKRKGPIRPKYSGPPPPPNRFNILPGYR